MHLKFLIVIIFLLVGNNLKAEETDPNLNKTLSEADILLNIKKNIKPVIIQNEEINTSSTDKNINNEHLNLNVLLSQAYKATNLGQLEAAVMLYKKALKIDKNNTYILFALGSVYHLLKQYDDAKAMYTQLLSIDPNDEQAINNYLALMAVHSPAKALKQLQEMEKINPNYSPVKAQIAMIYANLGEFSLAEMYLRKAIELSPEVITYRYNLAILFDKMTNYKDALRMYIQILDFAGDAISKQNANIIQHRINFLHQIINSK